MTKVVLGVGVTLLRCVAIPPPGHGLVLLDAEAVLIKEAYAVHRVDIPLAHRLLIPTHSFNIVSFDGSARFVHETEHLH